MSRRLQKSMWKEGHRRSPRISALDAWKAQPSSQVGTTSTSTGTNNTTGNHSADTQGPTTSTRSRKKRKLRPLEDMAATSILPNAQQADKQQSHGDHPINSDQQLVQGDDSPKNEDQASYPDQPSSAPSTPWMPEKRILELILDILQRRDTHEIFAEPVDPEEVEDYYEIIKEPMDFGTMRAKLHEGMYESLEQFEHDVFLISRNAMHFNSSATVYFRQARAIHELATKVFHAIKTDPENFELEFSETRRRSGRRPHTEARGPFYSSSPKLAANSRSIGMTSNISSKNMPSSLNGSSNLKRSIRRNTGYSGTASHFNTTDHEVPSGAVDGRRNSFLEVDRRCTYRPWTSFLNENDSNVSTIYNNSKSLMHVNQRDISYKESLMLFVKDLGPTAQMTAQRKLHGWSADTPYFQTSGSNYWSQAPEHKNPTASTSAQQELTALDSANPTLTSQNILDHLHGHLTALGNTSDRIDLCDADKGGRNYTGASCSTLVEVASNSDKKKIPGAFRGEVVHSSNKTNIVGIIGSNKVEQNGSTGIQLGSFSNFAGARDLNFSVGGLKETGNKPTTMISNKSKLDNQAQLLESGLEHYQSNLLEFRLKNNYSPSSSSWPLQTMGLSSSSFNETKGLQHNLSSECLRSNDQAIAAQGPSHGVCSSSEAGQQPSRSSQFIFDLPYLKTRLDQINSLGQDRMSKQGSHMENSQFNSDKMSYQRALSCTHQAELSTQPYNDERQQSSLDIQHTDLALQL